MNICGQCRVTNRYNVTRMRVVQIINMEKYCILHPYFYRLIRDKVYQKRSVSSMLHEKLTYSQKADREKIEKKDQIKSNCDRI